MKLTTALDIVRNHDLPAGVIIHGSATSPIDMADIVGRKIPRDIDVVTDHKLSPSEEDAIREVVGGLGMGEFTLELRLDVTVQRVITVPVPTDSTVTVIAAPDTKVKGVRYWTLPALIRHWPANPPESTEVGLASGSTGDWDGYVAGLTALTSALRHQDTNCPDHLIWAAEQLTAEPVPAAVLVRLARRCGGGGPQLRFGNITDATEMTVALPYGAAPTRADWALSAIGGPGGKSDGWSWFAWAVLPEGDNDKDVSPLDEATAVVCHGARWARPRIALMNTTILAPASWDDPVTVKAEKIDTDDARGLIRAGGYVSHVGHESTAQIMSLVLDTEVDFDRTPVQMRSGDVAVALKLRGRVPEGTILTAAEVEEIGFDLIMMVRS